MAFARKCDRCGKLYELKEIVGIEAALARLSVALGGKYNMVITKKIHVVTSELDLCTDCTKSFKQWWKEAKNEAD